MSISSTADRIQYVGNSATTAFAFPYNFLAEGDIVVVVSDADGSNPVIQTITTDYTVSGGGGSTGTVTFGTAPDSGVLIDIYRWVAPTQGVDFLESGPLGTETVERALDRLAMVDQQIISRLGGATFDLATIEFLGRDDDDPAVWDAEGDRLTGLATPTASTDAVTKAYADAIVATAGNVPAPSDPADDGKVLTADSGTFSWESIPASLVPTPSDPADDGKHLSADSGGYILRTAAQSRTDLGLGTAATATTGTGSGQVPLVGTASATTTLAGLVELATNAETTTGTDTSRVAPVSAIKSHEGVGKAWACLQCVQKTGTYTHTGASEVTVSISGHGLTTGMYASLNFTSGDAGSGWYQVTVSDGNTYTVVEGGSIGGNVTQNLFMRDGYGIASVADGGTGIYTITLSSAFGSTNYAWIASARRSAVSGAGAALVVSNGSADTKTSTALLVRTTVSSSAGAEDAQELNIWFIGDLA